MSTEIIGDRVAEWDRRLVQGGTLESGIEQPRWIGFDENVLHRSDDVKYHILSVGMM